MEPSRAIDAHNTIEASRLKMEPWRVIDQWSLIRITLMRSKIRIRIKVKDGYGSALN
jgi:hypothetical protein